MEHIKTTRYSIQPRDLIFLKSYRFFSFTKNMSQKIGKHISQNLSIKYSHRRLDLGNMLQKPRMQLKK